MTYSRWKNHQIRTGVLQARATVNTRCMVPEYRLTGLAKRAHDEYRRRFLARSIDAIALDQQRRIDAEIAQARKDGYAEGAARVGALHGYLTWLGYEVEFEDTIPRAGQLLQETIEAAREARDVAAKAEQEQNHANSIIRDQGRLVQELSDKLWRAESENELFRSRSRDGIYTGADTGTYDRNLREVRVGT